MSVCQQIVPRRERRGVLAMVALVALVASACNDQRVAPLSNAPTAPGRANFDQSPPPAQAFTWLAPLGTGVANPATFDAAFGPRIEICVWVSGACAGAPVATFNPLVANTVVGEYEASWNLLNTAFITRKTYRIRVFQGTGTTEVGAILVDVVRGRWALTRSDGTQAPLLSANALPINFHIAKITCVNTSSCVAQVVPAVIPTGTSVTVKTNDLKHWITFHGDAGGHWNTAGVSAIVTVEDVSAQLGSSVQGCEQGITSMVVQGNCVKISTDPVITLATTAVVCMTLDSFRSQWQMLKYDAGQPPRVKFLSDPPSETCPQTGRISSTSPSSNPLVRVASRIGHAIGGFLTPKSAYAFDLGVGGLLDAGDGFSFFAPGIAARMLIVTGNNQTAAPGTIPTTPLAVQLINTHENRNTPISGAIVTCTVTSGGGSLPQFRDLPGRATENPAGTYTCPSWTLGATAGVNTLGVTASTVDPILTGGSVTFTANGTGNSVVSVSVAPKGGLVSIGGVLTITPTVVTTGDASTAVVWSSSNTAVATVDANGGVTGVAAGVVFVRATSIFDDSKSASAEIAVVPPGPGSAYIAAGTFSEISLPLGINPAGNANLLLINNGDLTGSVTLQTAIEQGDVTTLITGSTTLGCKGTDPGFLPAGACVQSITYATQNADGSSGQLTTGPAILRLQLIQGGAAPNVLDTKRIPITLLNTP